MLQHSLASVRRNCLKQTLQAWLLQGSAVVPGREPQKVVLKRVKRKIQDAKQLAALEHLLNAYAARHAPSSCAAFIGYCDIQPNALTGSKYLTPGTWLVIPCVPSPCLGLYACNM